MYVHFSKSCTHIICLKSVNYRQRVRHQLHYVSEKLPNKLSAYEPHQWRSDIIIVAGSKD